MRLHALQQLLQKIKRQARSLVDDAETTRLEREGEREGERDAGTHMKVLLGVQVMEIFQNQKYLSNDYVYWTLVNTFSVIILVNMTEQCFLVCMYEQQI